MNMKKAIILGVVLIFTSLHLFAQDDDTIKVRTKRDALDPSTTSLATTIITSDEIEAMGADNVAEVLENVVGVMVRDSEGDNVIHIRGAAANQTLVLVNGVKQNLAQGLPPNLSLYSTGNVERIEIIRGAAATRYGSGAIGGVINIITKDRVDSVTGAEVRIKYGSYNAVTASVLGNMTFGKNNQGNVFLSGSITTNSRNFDFEGRDENGASVISGEMKNNELFTGDAMLGFGYRFNDKGDKINVSLSAMYDDRNSSGKYNNFGVVGFGESWNYIAQRYGGEVSYEHYSFLLFNFKLSASTFYDIKDNNHEIFGTNHFTNSSSILSASFDREDKFGDVFTFYNQLNFSYGFEHFVDSRVNLALEDDHTVNRQTISIAYLPELGFLNYEGTDVSRITILPAIRFDAIIDSGATDGTNYYEPTYSVGLMYTFDPERRYIAKANFASSYRLPTFNDLYWVDPYTVGDPNLKKENAISGDIGFAVQPINMIRFEALYYVTSVDDMIAWDWSTGETRPYNIESALLQGIESTVALLVPIKPINSNIELSLNYLYQFGVGSSSVNNINLKDKKLPFTPEHSVVSMLSYIYGGNDILTQGRLNFLVNYVGERYDDLANKTILEEYVTLDITASVTFIDIVTLEGGVKNVLDERYEYKRYFAQPGREFYIALSGRI